MAHVSLNRAQCNVVRVPECCASFAESVQIVQAAALTVRCAVLLDLSLGEASFGPDRFAIPAVQSGPERDLLKLAKEVALRVALFIWKYPFGL